MRGASWIDIGSGAGLPGIVIACLVDGPVTLVEPRRLRAEFLHKVGELLQLDATCPCTQGRARRGEIRRDHRPRGRAAGRVAEDIRTSVHKKYRLGASEGAKRAQRNWPKRGRRGKVRSTWNRVSPMPTPTIVVATGVRAKR